MNKIILKLLYNEQINYKELYLFIEFIFKAEYPEKVFVAETVNKLLSIPHLAQAVIQTYTELFLYNPAKFNYEVLTILDKSNNLIAYKIYNING